MHHIHLFLYDTNILSYVLSIYASLLNELK